MKLSFGLLSLLIVILAMPITVVIALQTQNDQQHAAYSNANAAMSMLTPPPVGNCIPRPSCLDTRPSCTLPVPRSGWCASTVTPSPTPQIIQLTCPVCLTQQKNYKCVNLQTNAITCQPSPIASQSFSCTSCVVPLASPTQAVRPAQTIHP